MIETTDHLSITTFCVSEVEPAVEALSTVRPLVHWEAILKARPEACSDYFCELVDFVTTNPLISAAKLAFDQHRPLCLSPDMIWLTILQGVAEHCYDSLLSRSESVLPKAQIVVSTKDLPFGSLEADWNSIVQLASANAKDLIPDELELLFSTSFSTTGRAEQTAYDLTLLSGLDRFVTTLDSLAICGFPSITIEGTKSDWKAARQAIEHLDKLGLTTWRGQLRVILDQFVLAVSGQCDKLFWEQMVYRRRDGICVQSDIISGWIANLFPYGARFGEIPQRRRLDDHDDTDIVNFPIGCNSVSIRSQRQSVVQIHAGFLGVEQRQDLTLRPKIGWVVRRRSAYEALLEEIGSHPRCLTTAAKPFNKQFILSRPPALQDLFGDNPAIFDYLDCRQLQQFYSLYHDLRILSASDNSVLLRVRSPEEIGSVATEKGYRIGFCVGDLADGRILALVTNSDRSRHVTAYFVGYESEIAEFLPAQLVATNFESVLYQALRATDCAIDGSLDFVPIGRIRPRSSDIDALMFGQ